MGRLLYLSFTVFHLSPSRLPLIPLCLSFELYPLNLQLWGAAGMRDTFSRKFARRILKPRGKQDQYLVSQEEGTRWSWLWYPAVLWLAAQSFCMLSFRSSFLLAAASRRRGRTTPYVVKDEGYRITARRSLMVLCVLRRDLPSFPFRCVEKVPCSNIITYYVRDKLYIGCITFERIQVHFRLRENRFKHSISNFKIPDCELYN